MYSSTSDPNFDGEFYKFADVEMYPKTFQRVLPTYVGGNNPNALERTVKYATGWLPASMEVEVRRGKLRKYQELAEEAGLEPARNEVATQ